MTIGPALERPDRRQLGPSKVTWPLILSHALTLSGALVAMFIWLGYLGDIGNPADGHAYYVVNLDDMYLDRFSGRDAFVYSPAIAQLAAVLRSVPFEAFVALIRGAALITIVLLAGPFTIPVLFLPPVASEINAANINIFLAGAIAIGFRWPAAWALVLLTKITPAVGLLWFVVRREWRKLGTALVAAAIIAAASFILAPGQWLGWAELVIGNSGANPVTGPYLVPLSVRLPLAAIAVYYGARLNHRWILPIAAMVAAPILYFPTQSIALGALPFIRHALGERIAEGATFIRRRRAEDQPGEPRSR